jgi:hypothetical protein
VEVVHQAAGTISAAVRLRCLVRWGAELDLEAEGLCKGDEGVEGPHSGLRGTLQEIVVSVCQGSRQVHLSDLFEWPLQGERKKQRP